MRQLRLSLMHTKENAPAPTNRLDVNVQQKHPHNQNTMHHILISKYHILKICPHCYEEGQIHTSGLQTNNKQYFKEIMHTTGPFG